MNNTIRFLVDEVNNGSRVDIFLSKNIKHLSRSYIKKLIEDKKCKVNKIVVIAPSFKLKKNDEVLLHLIKENTDKIIPKKMKLNIIFEDDDIIVINKPKGMVVHPGAGNFGNTLANGLAYKYKNNLSSLNGELRPGIIHRIDKNTSGLLVVAKNNLSHSKLGKQFFNHTIKRKYRCLTWGVLRPLNGRVTTLIARSKKNRQLMSVSEIKGKNATTNYKTIRTFNLDKIPRISLIECELETGRTHQIRVHLKHKGVSILGDNQYGKKNLKFKKVNIKFLETLNAIKGQALHAQTLEFIHPTKNKWVSFTSYIPEDFKNMLNLLNKLSS